MKIILVNNLYGRHARGGAERVVEAEARGLAAAGHDVAVVSGIPKSDTAAGGVCGVDGCGARRIVIGGADGLFRTAEYDPQNVFFYKELHRHRWPARLVWHALDIWNRGSTRTLMAFVRREKPDAVHTHNLMGLGFSIPGGLRREGVRHIHTVHDVQLLHPSGLLPAEWKGPRWPHEHAYVRIMRRRMGSPDIVVFPSAFMKELHERFGFFPRSRRVVLRNPVDLKTRDTRRKTQVLNRFLFVGQLEEHKGILDLLDAWMLWEGRGDAVLSIVGSGVLEDAVRRRAEFMPAVEFLGRLEGEEFGREMDRASWLVVPSKVIENAPTVIVEALARGIPVIASRTGGIPELVRDGENGILFGVGEKEALLAALAKAEGSKLKVPPFGGTSPSLMKYSGGAESVVDMPTVDEHLEALEGYYE